MIGSDWAKKEHLSPEEKIERDEANDPDSQMVFALKYAAKRAPEQQGVDGGKRSHAERLAARKKRNKELRKSGEYIYGPKTLNNAGGVTYF